MQNKTKPIAFVISAAGGMLIGFLWYGVFFAQSWMSANGFTQEGEKMFKNGVEVPMSPTPMIVNLLVMVAYALIINWLLRKMNISTWADGALAGGIIGLVLALNEMTGNLFAMHPAGLTMIDGSYALVLFAFMGAVLAGWKR